MAKSGDFSIASLRGGLNSTDPPLSLMADQATVAENVEWVQSTLGERRNGCTPIDLPSSITSKLEISFLHRNLPTNDETQSQLWALGLSFGASTQLAYKDTAWHDVVVSDAITNSGTSPYELQAVTLHGKMFLAYDSAVNRLHVWDGTSLRRAGLAEPNAPTGANTGSGSFSGTRYYRVRYTVQSGGATILRSEPSTVLTFAPSGSGTGVVVTKPATIGEGETHWELEASLNNVDFYRIATTVVGTTTATDSTAFGTGYTAFTLSENIGDYELFPSVRYLIADEDRLVGAGSFEDAALASVVVWSPVYNDPGVGNDERIPTRTDNLLSLDGFQGGRITGMSEAVNGVYYVFKWGHIYQMVRTGQRTQAYQAIPVTKIRGALPGSITTGLDAAGRACVYFCDPKIGPCTIGADGLQTSSQDIVEAWKARINLNATVVSRVVYYPDNHQVHWFVAFDGATTPSHRLVLHTNLQQASAMGLRRGFAIHSGKSCEVLAACLYATNINTNAARSLVLKPFVGLCDAATADTHYLQMLDSGDDDDGEDFIARLVTRPFILAGLNAEFGIKSGAIMATAASGVTIEVTAIRNFGVEERTVTADLTPVGAETFVIRRMDDLSFSNLIALQIEFSDPVSPTSRWELHQLDLSPRPEQSF